MTKQKAITFKKASGKTNWPVTIALIICTVFVLFPLYMAVVVAFKKGMSTDIAGILSLPSSWSLDNFIEAIQVTDFFHSLLNSLLITVVSVVVTIVLHSLIAYAIGRNMGKSRLFRMAYYFIISGMYVPFAILMMPLVKQTAVMHLDNPVGVMCLYVVFYMPFDLMLYTSYLKNVPTALDEAARVDGASTMQTFRMIIFPLLKPMHATVAVLNGISFWNDFMTPMIIMGGTGVNTLPLAQQTFQSAFSTNYNLAFASYLLAMLPMILFYLIAQKQIVNGMTSGAVK